MCLSNNLYLHCLRIYLLYSVCLMISIHTKSLRIYLLSTKEHMDKYVHGAQHGAGKWLWAW